MTLHTLKDLPMTLGVRSADLSNYVRVNNHAEYLAARTPQRNAWKLARYIAARQDACGGTLHPNDQALVEELYTLRAQPFEFTLIDEIKTFGTTLDKLLAQENATIPPRELSTD